MKTEDPTADDAFKIVDPNCVQGAGLYEAFNFYDENWNDPSGIIEYWVASKILTEKEVTASLLFMRDQNLTPSSQALRLVVFALRTIVEREVDLRPDLQPKIVACKTV